MSWDLLGLFRWYGFWGGPGWAGDTNVNDGWMKTKPYLLDTPALDQLDRCYKSHDICYEKCREKYPCDDSKKGRCFSKCDYLSVPCQISAMAALSGKNDGYGALHGFLGAWALGGQGAVRSGILNSIEAEEGKRIADAATATVINDTLTTIKQTSDNIATKIGEGVSLQVESGIGLGSLI